jgi:hypothetical protein
MAGPESPVTEPGATPAPSVTAPAATSTQTVTLVTGDTVTLTTGADGKSAVDVRRGKGREFATFLSSEQQGEVSVVPDDAIPLRLGTRTEPCTQTDPCREPLGRGGGLCGSPTRLRPGCARPATGYSGSVCSNRPIPPAGYGPSIRAWRSVP